MRIEGGRVTSATDAELFRLYLEREYDDVMSFNEYRLRMREAGCEEEA